MTLDLFQLRKLLHQTPELAFQEHRTKELLLSYLKKLTGIKIHEFSTNTGILIEYSQGQEAYRLFRADMDALPVSEQTGCAFSSLNQGMMHACGHDIHMTVLMGLIARICAEQPRVNLLFLFQPAEEGWGGAEAVLAEGLIQTFNVKEVYALHVAGGMELGKISSREGVFFAIPQEFDVTFRGKAAHVAFSGQGINALQAGLRFMNMMQESVARLSQREKVIFHVGKMEAGRIRNVVADICKLEGTHRSLRKEVSGQLNDLIQLNSRLAADEYGATAKVDLLCSYDPVVNAPALVAALKEVVHQAGAVWQEAETAMTGEDFGFFTTRYPGLLFWLGSGCKHPLHSELFLADEACIPLGVEIFTRLALRN